MKRLIVCCDGTWQDLKTNYPTNVVKLVQAITKEGADGVPQIIFYDTGIGTGGEGKITGGLTGKGINRNIIDCYLFLVLNYEPGDEIYLFGFSRGSYTVRSLAGLIYCSGLPTRKYIRKIPEAFNMYRDPKIKPGDKKAIDFRGLHGERVPITLLGCWDTVGALGVPDTFWLLSKWNNRKYKFHDTSLNAKIENALHAVAIEERRRVFNVTIMEKSTKAPNQRLRQSWFIGGHGCVGGGSKVQAPLSDITFQWMVDGINQYGLGLGLDLSLIATGLSPDHKELFENAVPLYYRSTGTIHRTIEGTFDDVDISVKKRWRDQSDYRPENLVSTFEADLNTWAQNNLQ